MRQRPRIQAEGQEVYSAATSIIPDSTGLHCTKAQSGFGWGAMRQDFTSQFILAWDLLCIPDWPWSHSTLQSTCSGIADMNHHAQLENDNLVLIAVRRSDANAHFSAIHQYIIICLPFN